MPPLCCTALYGGMSARSLLPLQTLHLPMSPKPPTCLLNCLACTADSWGLWPVPVSPDNITQDDDLLGTTDLVCMA